MAQDIRQQFKNKEARKTEMAVAGVPPERASRRDARNLWMICVTIAAFISIHSLGAQVGPAGATGATGPTGPVGATGLAGVAAAGFPVAYNASSNTVSIIHAYRTGMKIIGRNYAFQQSSVGNGGSIATNTRKQFVAKGPISNVQLLNFSRLGTGATESAFPAPYIFNAAIEYPVGIITTPVTFNGSPHIVVDPSASGVLSDVVGVSIPAGATFYVRDYVRTSTPPTLGTAAMSPVVGALTENTTYFFKITAMDYGIESGPGFEFSLATGAGVTSLALSWAAAPNGTPTSYNIYAGAAANSEVLVARVPAPSTGFLYQGPQAVSSAVPPPQPFLAFTGYVQTGDSCDGTSTNTADATAGLSRLPHVGPNTIYQSNPYVLLGDDTTSNPVMAWGDSIEAGIGIQLNNMVTASQILQNWFDLGFTNGQQGTLNASIAGAKAIPWTDNSQTNRTRFNLSQYADVVVTDMGHNDIYAGATWQNLALYQIALGTALHNRGVKFYITTLTPQTGSSDNWTTMANQPAPSGAVETNRQNYNTWVRNGFQMSAGAPVAAGGTATPAIDGFFDLANAVEVNSSGVSALNGGYWPAAGTNIFTGQVLTGSPTLTNLAVAGTPFKTGSYGGYVIRITNTDSPAFNQTAVINVGTTSSALTLYANNAVGPDQSVKVKGLTFAPVAGDTFDVYPVFTSGGIHPAAYAHTVMGAAFAAWVSSNLAPF